MSGILITGGTGAFGKAFVNHLLDDTDYDRICIYSRDEYKQAMMREQFDDDQRLRFFIGCVRDKDRLKTAMIGVDIVIHGAALKRIEVGNYAPDEMVRTNILGSMNVIDAAFDTKIKKVVFLSTDKAWQGGISPYGQSKALAESLFLNANNTYGEHGPKYSVVRYGNIWGSTGSIVPTWRLMIANGAKTVPVTDPDCTRFMMRINEAVQFVLSTIKTMKGGELNIPETLPAYRVGDLAEAMDVDMNIKGLPSWERKHEGMRDGLTSDIVRRLTVDELKAELANDKEAGT